MKKLLGQVLIERKLITPEQLDEALDIQDTLRELSENRRLGEILVYLGVVHRRQIESAVRAQRAATPVEAR